MIGPDRNLYVMDENYETGETRFRPIENNREALERGIPELGIEPVKFRIVKKPMKKRKLRPDA